MAEDTSGFSSSLLFTPMIEPAAVQCIVDYFKDDRTGELRLALAAGEGEEQRMEAELN